jgi:chromosome segregation ATPase
MGSAGTGWAQDARAAREREALRQLQQQVQQMRQENDTLAARLAAAEQDKLALESETRQLGAAVQRARARDREVQTQEAQAQARHDALARDLQAMTADRDGLQVRRDALERELAAMRVALGRAEESLVRGQIEREGLISTVARRDESLAQCGEKNQLLYRHGRDLIAQCQDRSVTDTALRLEPFTGIRRVAMENLLQEYRDKLDAQTVAPRTP